MYSYDYCGNVMSLNIVVQTLDGTWLGQTEHVLFELGT